MFRACDAAAETVYCLLQIVGALTINHLALKSNQKYAHYVANRAGKRRGVGVVACQLPVRRICVSQMDQKAVGLGPQTRTETDINCIMGKLIVFTGAMGRH